MSDAIIVAIITAGATIIAVILQNRSTQQKIMSEMDKRMAVMDTKVDELTREVRDHNNFARRMPVLEEKMEVANHRIADLERKVDNG